MDYSRIVFENAGEAPSGGTAPNYAFVGIYEHGDGLVFRLPIGYPKPVLDNNYEAARDLHITFFKLFSRFRTVAQRNHERLKQSASVHEDAGPATESGREWITRHDEGDVYYYRHFDAFDSLLEAFNELMILGLERRLRLTENPPTDLRNFQRTDAGRVYQDDDSFYDDASLQPLPTVTLMSSDLVGLYCFLLRDLREHVWARDDPNPLQDDIRVLAEIFEEKHLWPNASCWEAAEWEQTRDALREKLEIIDRMTALKDEDYYRLYEAVERFLYPPTDNPNEAGELWGIDGFWPVWEWMVLTRLAAEPEYRKRLLWTEIGNLTPEIVDDLKSGGFQHPRQDDRVLCLGGGSWDTFLENGRKIGHPYPDAILRPADFDMSLAGWSNQDWRPVNELSLKEGSVSMSLRGLNAQLAVSTATSTLVRIRSKSENPSPHFDEDEEPSPFLMIIGNECPNLDRPEVIAMLHRLGKWEQGERALGCFKPFKSLTDVGRKHIGGVLLVDAKYKKPEDQSQDWANDHRKQAAYEDALTISCPDTPAAYSIYVCPRSPVTQDSVASLKIQLEIELERKEQFDREFDAQWLKLKDVVTSYGIFKNRRQTLEVFGKSTVVGYGNTQRNDAYDTLVRQICNLEFIEAEIAKNSIACSLLGVDRFPYNDNFFVKSWPIRELVDGIVDVN
jgi:hypothetical protein